MEDFIEKLVLRALSLGDSLLQVINSMKIEGKVAVVVGGSTGMGKACVEALLEKGAKVYFGDNQEDIGIEVEEIFKSKYPGNRAVYRKCDVTKLSDIQELMTSATKVFGQVEIFLNTAGIYDEINWEKCVDVNLNGAIRCTEVALTTMGKHQGGQGGVVIHIASIKGLQPKEWSPIYVATKHGIVGLIRSWAMPNNYERTGIRFNCICPTSVRTPFVKYLKPGARPEHTKEVDKVTASFITGQKISPRVVAEGFVKLVEEDEHNGRAMRISKTYGTDFATFEQSIIE